MTLNTTLEMLLLSRFPSVNANKNIKLIYSGLQYSRVVYYKYPLLQKQYEIHVADILHLETCAFSGSRGFGRGSFGASPGGEPKNGDWLCPNS